jgi:hypothetical protein
MSPGRFRRRATTIEIELVRPAAAQKLFGDASQSAWYKVSGGASPSVHLRLARDGPGIRCTAVVIGLEDNPPARIKATSLRLPLQELVAEATRRMRFDFIRGRKGVVAFYGDANELGFFVDTAQPAGPPAVSPGAKGFNDEDLVAFARDYRDAQKTHPHAWMQALAKKYERSDQAMRYRRRLAEKRGFLPANSRRHKHRGGRR